MLILIFSHHFYMFPLHAVPLILLGRFIPLEE
jgi:hypothetical protein